MAKTKKDAYVRFLPPALAELRELVNALPNDDTGLPLGELQVHGEGEDMTLHVVPAEARAQDGGGINEAHPCPPFC